MVNEFVVIADLRLKTEVDACLKKFESLSDQEAVFSYNRISKGGFFVRQQALQLLSLHYFFMRRFGRSPLIIEDNSVLRLTKQICLVEEQIFYADGIHI